MSDFKVGDRVRPLHLGGDGIVTGFGPKGGAHIVWCDATGWADNVRPEDLVLVSRPIHPKMGEVANLINDIDVWTSAAYPSTPLTDDEMRTARNAASHLFIKIRALLSGETEPVASTGAADVSG